MNEMGGTNAILIGNLKRRLVSTTLAFVQIAEGVNTGNVTVSATIRGLCKALDVFAGIGGFEKDAGGNLVPLPASAWPAAAGTMQITPQGNFPDRPKTLFRPLFQDPTIADNANHPLAQALPFSWNFPGECDEAVVDVVFNQAAWANFGINAQIDLQVMVEYVAPWWDATAVKLAMGQVQVTPPGKALTIFSTNIG